jgi:hypothetical protein
MEKDHEHVNIEFHNSAQHLFLTQFKEFKSATATINRRVNEHEFQATREKYVMSLQKDLENLAKDIMAKNMKIQNTAQLNFHFSQFINEYVYRFIQKIKDL